MEMFRPPDLAREGFIRDFRACTFLAISSAVRGVVLSSDSGAGLVRRSKLSDTRQTY
jgi:hypothetical protein